MRLWTQARVMGLFTARCMLDSELELDSWFDMFSHVTTFAGQKVCWLSLFEQSIHFLDCSLGKLFVRNTRRRTRLHGELHDACGIRKQSYCWRNPGWTNGLGWGFWNVDFKFIWCLRSAASNCQSADRLGRLFRLASLFENKLFDAFEVQRTVGVLCGNCA